MALVRLGSFVFTKSELPELLLFGGSESIAVHQLVGGKRVVDAMGVLEPDITWSGTFIGTGMLDKAQYLDQLMRSAQAVNFSYSRFFYSVLIKNFSPQYRDTYIDYSITLQVINNLTKPILFFPQLTWAQAFQDQLVTAQGLADLIKNGNITDQIGAIAAAVNLIPDLNLAGQAEITGVVGLIDDALGSVEGLISSIPGGL